MVFPELNYTGKVWRESVHNLKSYSDVCSTLTQVVVLVIQIGSVNFHVNVIWQFSAKKVTFTNASVYPALVGKWVEM